MEASTLITLIISTYGAIVSTIVGLNEIKSYKKHLRIIIEHKAFYETNYLVLINESRRPITIRGFSAHIDNIDPVPENSFFGENDTPGEVFPFTIKPYDSKRLVLGDFFSFFDESLSLTVYDNEGNAYTKFKKQIYNGKWGYVEKS